MKLVFAILTILFVAVLLLLHPKLAPPEFGKVISYRGLSYEFDLHGVDNKTCTANRVVAVEHSYIENSIPAIEHAIGLGADIVHLNIHTTSDGHLVAFHDWTLECRTNGKGVTSEQTLEYLKTLDAGFGYQKANSNEYPFRGKGIGLIPSLTEILDKFPEQHLLLNVKTKSPDSMSKLTAFINSLPEHEKIRISFLGADTISAAIQKIMPDTRVFSKDIAKSCLVSYLVQGWSRFYPKACMNIDIIIPYKYGMYLWGWPDQFAARAQANGSQVYLYSTSEPYDKSQDLRQQGIGIFTNDLVGLVEANNSTN